MCSSPSLRAVTIHLQVIKNLVDFFSAHYLQMPLQVYSYETMTHQLSWKL